MEQGKSREETEGHISRYGKDYFPDYNRGASAAVSGQRFRAVEMLWFFKYAGRLLGHEIRT